MAVIVRKTSDSTTYVVDGGKIVALHAGLNLHRFDVLAVDDTSWANLVSGYGSPVTGVPAASFTSAGTTPAHAVAFTDTSTNTPTSWSWTFGDGGNATTQNPSHTYAAPGQYTVTLIATNAEGASAAKSVVVTVA